MTREELEHAIRAACDVANAWLTEFREFERTGRLLPRSTSAGP